MLDKVCTKPDPVLIGHLFFSAAGLPNVFTFSKSSNNKVKLANLNFKWASLQFKIKRTS